MNNKYKYMVFDLGNTLIRFDHNISASKFASAFNTDQAKIYDTFFDSDITRPFERGHLSPMEFYQKASDLLKFKISFNDFVKVWNDIFWEDSQMCALARQLKRDGYKLILLSNISELHFEHIRKKFDIIGIFDELVLSYQVGAIKPERKIFDEVVRLANGERDSLFYIDDREDLIKAAKELNIDCVRFENINQLKSVMKEKGILA